MGCHKICRLFSLMIVFVALATIGYAEEEPNNDFAEANKVTLGSIVKAKIDVEGDKDYFEFNVSKPGVISLKAINIPAAILPEMVLYDSSHVDQKLVSGDGAELEIKFFTCLPGKYYVLFHDKDDNRTSDEEYQISIDVEVSDPNECNNTRETATPILLNQVVKGAIQNKKDVDYYYFTNPRSGTIKIYVTDIPTQILPRLTLYLENGKDSLVIKGASNDSEISLRYFTCKKGKFYLSFRDFNNNRESADQYGVKVILDTTDVYECNNSLNVPALVEVNKELTAAIQNEGDRDFYSFDHSGPGVLNIEVKNIPPNITPILGLYDKDRGFIKEVKGVKGANTISLNHFTCIPGRYHFFFRDYPNKEWSDSPYKFVIKNLIVDPNECNDKMEDATPIGINSIVKGAIQSMGDLDYYAINLGAGVLTINLKNIPKEIRAKVELFDPVENMIIGTKIVDSLATTAVLKRMVCKDGKYYVIIRDLSGKGHSFTEYELSLSLKRIDANECNNSTGSATKIKIGETLRGYIEIKGDKDYFRFENPEPGVVVAKVSSISPRIQPHLKALDREGNVIGEFIGQKGNKEVALEFATCESTDYYILFNDSSGEGEDENKPYELVLTHETLEQYECNNTLEDATKILLSTAIRAAIRPIGDIDFYKFDLLLKQPYQLMVDLVPDVIDVKVSLFASGTPDPLWVRSGGKGDTILQPFEVEESAEYILKLEDTDGNNFSTGSYYLLIREKPDQISENPLEGELKIFPNPVKSMLNITGVSVGQIVEIVDVNGRVVVKTNLPIVDVSKLSKGIYLLRTQLKSVKFIKD